MSTYARKTGNVDRFLQFIENRERRFDETEAYEVPEASQIKFHVLYAICAQSLRFAGSYVVLSRAGRTREAMVLARQALEHALTAQWAFFDETGVDQLIDSYWHSSAREFDIVAAWLGVGEDERNAILADKEEGKKLLRIAVMLDQIDYETMFKAAYTHLSQVVHVSSDTLHAFVDAGPDERLIFMAEAVDRNEEYTVRITAMAAMFASWVLETLREGSPGIAELEVLSDALELPLTIRDQVSPASASDGA